ncbi:hypothetical protein CLU95_4960 [Variovorax sp. 54]|uniref:prealbumin-like fold domain-containing protein n=1 Tax=Variovorax sp. 54 TaxID=2035212 RepID=UPI000C5BB0B0|nr:hypothetical protein [Variovorax sp. 54]PIF77781.1 hypothetical protein CLU95_4960 [Variovorax sp. 54]
MQSRTRNEAGGMAVLGGVLKGMLAATALWLFAMPGAQAATAPCTPQAGFNTCVAFTYSGSAQTFTVPAGVSSARVTMWGGGGGGSLTAGGNSANGGAGGFADGTVSLTPGTAMAVTVGQGGQNGGTGSTYGRGGGGGGGANAGVAGSSGGGMSALWNGSTEFSTAAARLVAGGGGGSAFWTDVGSPVPGGGGGTLGGSSSGTGGRGGTQSAGGAIGTPTTAGTACPGGSAGSALQGGTGCSASGGTFAQYEGGGGGGGGWFGGGGGLAQCSNTPNPVTAGCSYNGPGGGGSGFIGTGVTGGVLTAGANGSYSATSNPGNTSAPYQSGVGVGGSRSSLTGDTGGNGLVVIQFNVVTLQLAKAWSAGSNTNDVARIVATTGGSNFFGASNTATFTATAPAAGNSGTPVGVNIGNVITLPAETLTTGTLANYNTVLSCTVNSGTMASTLSGTNGQVSNTLTVALGDIGKDIVCTYTNTRKTATLQLAKSWNPTSVTGNVANIGATTGGAANTTAFASTAPTANTSTTVTVAAGNTITFPAETMSSGALANYTTVLSCTAGGGTTANTLSGTNGQATNTLVIGAADEGKAIVCTYRNTPKTSTLQLAKAWGANSLTGNVASIGVSSGGTNNTAAFTATAPTAATSGTAVTVATGNTITLPAETLTTGTLANYNTVLACTADGGTTANTLSGTNGQNTNTLVVGAADAGKAIVCTYTNTPKQATLQIAKAWGANSITGNVASLGASTGGANNTTAFTATAPTAANSGTAVTVVAGNTITFPAETMTTGTLANYNTVLACTAGGGATANALSGTNGQVTNTLLIGPADAGKAIVCTYTNTGRPPPTVLLGKAPGAGPVANTTFDFVLTGLSRTTASITTTRLQSVNDPLGSSTGSIGVPVTITEVGIPSAWSNYITSLGCTDSNSAVSGNPASFAGTVSGNVATIPAANMRANAILTCTVQNRRPSVQIGKVVVGTAPDGGKFNLTVSGGRPQTEFLTNPVIDVSSGGFGDRVGVDAGSTITISETAGTLTSLSNYTATASCSSGVAVTPVSGTPGAFTLTAPSASATPAARDITCTITNTPIPHKLQLRKTWSAGSLAGDAISVTTMGGSANAAITSVATAAGNTTNGTAVDVAVGDNITLPVENFTSGSAVNYTSTVSCNNSVSPLSNATLPASFTVVAADTAVLCTYTNTQKTVTLQVHKAWGTNSEVGNVASIGATTGGTNNTALFTATAPTAANSGTAVVAAVGNTITFPAETMTTGTLANYTTVLSCTADGGATANALSGTNGQASNTLVIGAGDTGKTIVCTYTNTRKTAAVTLSKTWTGAIAGDKVNLTVSGSAAEVTGATAGTSTAPATTTNATATAASGATVTLAEAFTVGSAANYTTTLACTKVSDGSTVTLAGSGLSRTFTMPSDSAVNCAYTNTRKTGTLQLFKAWSAGSTTGHVASIGATTGGASNTTAFTATAPTAGNSGTAVSVAAGDLLTFPAETMTTGTLANYTTVLSCTADGGATANTLSGTNGQVSNTLLVGAGDAGKAIACTYTNTPKTATLQLAKAWNPNSIAGNVANIGASTGGSNNTTAFTATAPTGANSGTAVTVQAGNTITLPAESMAPGTLANYTSVLACTAGGGATANALSGTNGQVSNTLLVGAGDAGKAIVCTYTNTPKTVTVQLRKAWSADSTSGDVASIGATSGGSSNTVLFTATAPTAGNSGTAVSMVVGGTLTLPAETMTTGSLANYGTVLACTADGGATTNPLSGTNGQVSNTLAIAAADAGKAIVCTYTNAKKTVTLQVRKAWGANSETGNVASIGATTGGANNTALFTATAPTAGNSGTAVIAAVGNTITFPAETMPTGTLANYTTVLSCTADGGATANALSGTNGQAGNTLVIGAGDAGKAIACTYSNNRLPTVQIRKQALGGTGTFAFSGTNGFGADSINVSVSGSTVVGTIKTLTTANTQTVLTEVAASMPGGFAFSGATCTGLAGGASAAVDLVAGTVTLPAAGLTNGTAVVCTFTNTLAAIVSGRVFLDNGIGSGTANDGIVNGGEGPLSGVSVRLTNCGATVYASALTDASGGYSLSVPAGTATGSAMCVEETNPGTRVSTGASVGNVALPSGSAVAAAGGTYTYTRTGTPDRIAFSWNGTGHSNLNFGDVDNSAFATDGAKTGLPGSTVTYAHTFTAGTGGQVRFNVASETATPPITGWTTKVFADVGCTGSLQPGAAQLFPPSAAATPVVFAGKVCVIVQEFIPATAPLGSSNKATIRADFSYTNAAPSLSGSFTLDDLTTVSGVALELKKEVRNITQSGTFGVNNQAKSGETLEYRITYTNNGDAPIRSMVVNDMTPGYTTFVSATTGTTPASLTGCVKNTPANAPPAGAVACTTVQPAGGTGAIDWRFTGTVEPGGTGFVLFQVKVD